MIQHLFNRAISRAVWTEDKRSGGYACPYAILFPRLTMGAHPRKEWWVYERSENSPFVLPAAIYTEQQAVEEVSRRIFRALYRRYCWYLALVRYGACIGVTIGVTVLCYLLGK
jgi:hypothetical protein